jgi:hypothetical protein
MSIPLDQLYYYIGSVLKNICNNRILIYRFYPHGSKKVENLTPLYDNNSWVDRATLPTIICNDQEPLDYYFYNLEKPFWESSLEKIHRKKNITHTYHFGLDYNGIWDKLLLLHSEERSNHVDLYKNTRFIPVYYWSHAIIALDWFRFTEHINQEKNVKNIFLIYNRAWSGTREYRLKFAELLVKLKLDQHCQTCVNPIEPELGIHYAKHAFKNLSWQPNIVLEDFFAESVSTSESSATFNISDYESTDIEVVLETLFDDTRLHLTEKSLRPLALGQPFILAGTHGSLKYLQRYGFKTYSNVWNEQYDSIENTSDRLNAICDLMQQISTWDQPTRERKMAQARKIADYNKKYFFSNKFFNLITNELKTNLNLALEELELTNTSKYYIERRELVLENPEIFNSLLSIRTEDESNYVIELANKYYRRIIGDQSTPGS